MDAGAHASPANRRGRSRRRVAGIWGSETSSPLVIAATALLACIGNAGGAGPVAGEESNDFVPFVGYDGDITPLYKLYLPLGPCKLLLWEPCGRGDDVTFHLFSSKNGGATFRRMRLYYPVTKKLIRSSGFDASLPTKVIIHGYGGGFAEDFISQTLRDAYIQFGGDVNIINMDWGKLSRAPCYPSAVINTLQGGHCLAQFLESLSDSTGLDISKVHAVGLSLGAHLAAFASNDLSAGKKLGRITGLDPALPFFASLRRSWKLDASDAHFVDVIHTNSGVFGKIESTGHVDFYVNGGHYQPACATANNIQLCSHVLSAYYFAESVDKDSPGFYGLACSSYFLYVIGYCTPSLELTAKMGEYTSRRSRGIFIVQTADSPPFALGLTAALTSRSRKSKNSSKKVPFSANVTSIVDRRQRYGTQWTRKATDLRNKNWKG